MNWTAIGIGASFFGVFTFLVIATDEIGQGKIVQAMLSVFIAAALATNLLFILDVL